LIATASVAASIAGWALLPSNDPQATASTTVQQDPQPALTAPSTTGNTDNSSNGSTDTLPQLPSIQQPTNPSNDQLPQVQAPQGFSSAPMPFTRSHSSR
jgi:hypothetical protein